VWFSQLLGISKKQKSTFGERVSKAGYMQCKCIEMMIWLRVHIHMKPSSRVLSCAEARSTVMQLVQIKMIPRESVYLVKVFHFGDHHTKK